MNAYAARATAELELDRRRVGRDVLATVTGRWKPNRLDVKDPAAVALGYVENASQVDARNIRSS